MKNLDKIVELYKAENRLESKELAVKQIIKNSKKCNHIYEVLHKEIIGRVSKQLTVVQRCSKCGDITKNHIIL